MNTPSSLAERLADVSATVRHRTLTQKRRDEAADIIDQAATALRPVLPPEVEELKKLAAAATQGPRFAEYDDNGFFYVYAEGGPRPYLFATATDSDEDKANAGLAAVNPQTVLKLIASISTARADGAREMLEKCAKALRSAADDTIRAFILLMPEAEHHLTLEQFAKAMDELVERIQGIPLPREAADDDGGRNKPLGFDDAEQGMKP